MKIKSTLIAGAMALTALIGVTTPAVASTDRPTAQPLAASAWVPVYLHAYSGNGCASYDIDQRLEPIISMPCDDSAWWYYRDLSRSSGAIQDNDELEFVDESKTFALGYSGGLVKLETPNDDSTYVIVDGQGYLNDHGPWQSLEVYAPGLGIQPGYGMIPESAGDSLGTPISPALPPDAWLECPLANPECSGGVLT
jgi:hypothetical protein